ncbi:hypothetical protein FD31_GL000769 [Companilactobacillus nantensis DSM 16982]|uniref:BspA family leucine-rich repeat surface protein n=2 Tax=Companilactobacillus nantensis TaxID=305793 RepID=A0A0R1WDQ7_9LACO|nr:hypothetical protein FD31_GL000769 [Companilactobacillus nantensis DSM 16982]
MAFLPFLGGQVVHADDVNIQDVLSQDNGTTVTNSTNTIMPLTVESAADPTDIASGTFGDADWSIDANGKLSITTSKDGYTMLPKLTAINSGPTDLPWKNYTNQIKSVYVGKNVGANAQSDYLFSTLPNVVSIDVSNLDTLIMKSAEYMFLKDSKLVEVIGLENWNIPYLTSISHMFDSDSALTSIEGIGNWDTSRITNISGLFSNAKSLKDISELEKWDTSSITNMDSIFYSTTITDFSPIKNWDVSKVTSMSSMFTYNSSVTSLDFNWDTSSVKFFTNIFSGCTNLSVINGLDKFKTENATNLDGMFNNDNKLLSLSDISNWNTSNVVNMSYTFSYCKVLPNLDLSEWDTSNVTNMAGMFSGDTNLNENNLIGLDKFDTSNVISMTSMFSNTGFTVLDLTNFSTSKVTTMNGMFESTMKLQKIIGNFDTSNVNNMNALFNQSSISDLSGLNISDWNTSKVTNMGSMFRSTTGIKTLDLSRWNTSNVTTYYLMFNNARALESIDISNFDMTNATDVTYIFYSTPKLWKVTFGPKSILSLPKPVQMTNENKIMLGNPKPGTAIGDTTYSAISDKWQEVDSDNGGTDHSPQGKLLSADELMDLYDQPGGPTETYVWQQQPKIDMNMSVPDIDFGRTYNSAGLVKRNDNFEIHVNNNSYPTDAIPAKIEVSMERPLTDSVDSSKTLNDVLIFKGEDNIEKVLSATDTEIYDGDIANGSSDLSWDNDHGILLNMNNDRFAQNGHYSTTLNWTLTNSL